MTTLSEVHQQSRRTLLSVHDGLERLERLESSSTSSSSSSHMPQDAPDLVQAIKRDLLQLQSLSAEMERLWRQQLPKSQRDLWRRKVEQVSDEIDSLKLGFDKVVARQHRRQVEAQERAELFRRMNGDSARVLEVFDEEQQALKSVKQSSNMLEDALSTGITILSKYSEQRDRLKQAQRKALDIMNTIGLSNSVLRIIEKRQRMDKWIAYAGMLIVSVLLIFAWRWVH